MKEILIKSLVIASLVAVLGSVVSDIFFAQRTEPYIFSEEEMAENQDLTLKEFSEKYKEPKIISGFQYVLNYPLDWWFWEQKLKLIAFNFCTILISCILVGSWRLRKTDT